MGTPAWYRIRVQGHIEPAWTQRLGGMSATESDQPDDGLVTTLVGTLPDQAALSGVLNILYSLHLPVLSAERLRVPNDEVSDK